MSILALDKVSYQYEGAKKNVLKNITIQFEHGKLYVIMGKSGAGKAHFFLLYPGLINQRAVMFFLMRSAFAKLTVMITVQRVLALFFKGTIYL